MRRIRIEAAHAFAAVVAIVLSTVSSLACAQATVLWYEYVPPPGGSGETTLYQQGTDTFSFGSLTQSDVRLNVNNSSLTNYAFVELVAPRGQQFTPGAQENVQEAGFGGAAAALYVSSLNHGEGFESGRFVILDLAYDSNFNVVSFAADFEQKTSTGGRFYGELRYNSVVPLTMNKAANAATPDPFAFPARTGALPGEPAVSNTITVYGTRATALVSIAGGEYSLNGAPFTTQPGFASNRDHIAVRVTASGSYGATTSATLTVGGVSASYNVTAFMPGTPFTELTLQSTTPDATLGNLDARPDQWVFKVTSSLPNRVLVNMTGPSGLFFNLQVGGPGSAALAVGPYEETQSYPGVIGSSPILNFSGPSCVVDTGRFVVHDISIRSDGTVDRLALTFEALCHTGPPLIGEVRFNSAVPLPSMIVAPNATPYPFALNAQMPVRAGALVRSNMFSILGVNQPVPLSIVGGQYSVNNGPFTSAPGTAQAGDHIVVQATASRWPGAVRTATLTAGGRSQTLAMKTYQQGMALTGIYYQSPNGDSIGQGETHLYLAPDSIVTADLGSPNNIVHIQAQIPQATRWDLYLAAANQALLTPGDYAGATRWPFQLASVPGLDFSGDGRGCNQSTDSFTVDDASYASGAIQSFAVHFLQGCENTQPPLYGEARFNSTVPFSALLGNECTSSDPACTADVAISQSAPATPGSGKDMVVDLTVTNNGPAAANNIVVTDMIPAGSSFVWASPGCANNAGTVTCAMAPLGVGAQGKLRVVARPASAGPVTNDVMVVAQEFDPNNANNASSASINVFASPVANAVLRYRLYSPVTQEHLYTTDLNEYNTLATYVGTWVQEGTVGHVLDNPGSFNGATATPYYRLYNTATSWHHWTTDPNEYYTLIQFPNWIAEGVDGYVLPTAATGATQLYRLVYPDGRGLHHWTIDPVEYGQLISVYGWVGEGGSGYVIQ